MDGRPQVLEWTAARKLEHLEGAEESTADTERPRSSPGPAPGGYLTRDAWASISMGLVSVATTAGWKLVALLGYAAIYTYLAP